MLINFTFNNFHSFKNNSTLNFQASNLKEFINENTFIHNAKYEERLLKSLILYGANSSGKSNIIKAFDFVRNIMINSSKDISIKVNKYKLSIDSENKNSTFEIKLYINQKSYRYGFSIGDNIVEAEWLKVTEKLKEDTYFERSGQYYINDDKLKKLSNQNFDFVKASTKPNMLFLSSLAHWNVSSEAIDIINWMQNKVTIILDESTIKMIEHTSKLIQIPEYKTILNHIICNSGLSIESVEDILSNVKNMDDELILATNKDLISSIRTKHNRYNEDNKYIDTIYLNLLKDESLGTQRYIGLMGMVVEAILENKLIFIDELDSKLHEDLLLLFIRFFNSSTNNPNNSQMVGIVHNSVVLDDPKLKTKKTIVRRDQLIFVEKDEYGSSSFESMYQKNPKIRNDASFRKEYRLGNLKALPSINPQLNLF